MTGAVVQLSDATELVSRLPFSAITVVLLTAFWSFETEEARHALNVASTLVDCGSLSVSYYEIPVSIHEIHASAATLPPWSHVPWSEARRTALAARNVTHNVPWFPAIRVFRDDESGVSPHTHVDSFAPGALASHIELHCRQSARELRRIEGWHGGKEAERETELTRLCRYTTPVSKDRFAREMGKDVFRSLGVLFLVRGGAKGIVDRWKDRWDKVARAVGDINRGKVENQDLRQRWVVSIVDMEKEGEIAVRNGADAGGEPSVVLVDIGRDSTATKVIGGDLSWEEVREALVWFERGIEKVVARRKGSRVRDREGRVLGFFDRPAVWREFFSRECTLCLSSYLERDVPTSWTGGCDGAVVVVVYAGWCGFSQRALPAYHRLRSRGGKPEVVLVSSEEMDKLPAYLDEMVDGFPTVIIVQEDGEARVRVEEYIGPHRVDEILAEVEGVEEEEVRWRR